MAVGWLDSFGVIEMLIFGLFVYHQSFCKLRIERGGLEYFLSLFIQSFLLITRIVRFAIAISHGRVLPFKGGEILISRRLLFGNDILVLINSLNLSIIDGISIPILFMRNRWTCFGKVDYFFLFVQTVPYFFISSVLFLEQTTSSNSYLQDAGPGTSFKTF